MEGSSGIWARQLQPCLPCLLLAGLTLPLFGPRSSHVRIGLTKSRGHLWVNERVRWARTSAPGMEGVKCEVWA